MRLLLLLFFPLSLFAQNSLDECKKDNSYLFDQLRTASGRINNQISTIEDLKETIKADGLLYYQQQERIILLDKKVARHRKNRYQRILFPIVGVIVGVGIAHGLSR